MLFIPVKPCPKLRHVENFRKKLLWSRINNKRYFGKISLKNNQYHILAKNKVKN